MIRLTAFLLASGLTVIPVSAQADIKFGLWEITVRVVKMEGMPNSGKLSNTTNVCLTPKNYVPMGKQGPELLKRCEFKHSMKGNTVTWKTVCKDRDMRAVNSGKIIFDGKNMKGLVIGETTIRGQLIKTVIDYSGRYLGKCRR